MQFRGCKLSRTSDGGLDQPNAQCPLYVSSNDFEQHHSQQDSRKEGRSGDSKHLIDRDEVCFRQMLLHRILGGGEADFSDKRMGASSRCLSGDLLDVYKTLRTRIFELKREGRDELLFKTIGNVVTGFWKLVTVHAVIHDK